jgi:hypothetical protein
VAHLAEHRWRVNALTASPPGCVTPWVLSASEYGAAKLWDCDGMERDTAFRTAATYASRGGRFTAALLGRCACRRPAL